MAPSVSIIVLCRNHERWVRSCLESIVGAGEPCEIVFVDNGSRDRSVEIAKDVLASVPPDIAYKVIALTPEQPMCRFFNVGIRASRGEFVKPMSSDDKLGPNFFSTFREVVAISKPDVGVWLAGSVIIDDSENIVSQQYGPALFGGPRAGRPELLVERHLFDTKAGPPHTTVSMFYRREVFNQVGGYDERFRYEDRPFLFNVLKRGWSIEVHPFNNTYYRVHQGGSSADPVWMAEARLPILWNHTLRATWRNKPRGLFHLARHVRYIAMARVRKRLRQ